jgi:hypothetical protein
MHPARSPPSYVHHQKSCRGGLNEARRSSGASSWMPGPTIYRFTSFIGSAKKPRERESLPFGRLDTRHHTITHGARLVACGEPVCAFLVPDAHSHEFTDTRLHAEKCRQNVTGTARNEGMSWHSLCSGSGVRSIRPTEGLCHAAISSQRPSNSFWSPFFVIWGS